MNLFYMFQACKRNLGYKMQKLFQKAYLPQRASLRSLVSFEFLKGTNTYSLRRCFPNALMQFASASKDLPEQYSCACLSCCFLKSLCKGRIVLCDISCR